MIPLYFPFTFVRAAAAEWLAATFETLCLLVPSAAHEGRCLAAGVDPGPWRVLFPPRDRDDDLARLETEMRQWADLHAGADLGALYAARPRDLPFWGAPSISRLRQRIRTGEKDAGAGADVDPLMAARVFLSFAHGLDQVRADLTGTWQSLMDMENEMFQDLHGSNNGGGEGIPAGADGEDPGAFLVERRLAAWARLALKVEVSPDLLITESPAVYGAVREAFPDLSPLFAWPLPTGLETGSNSWGDRFYQAIQIGLEGEVPAGAQTSMEGAHLQVSTLGWNWDDFCRRLAGDFETAVPASSGHGRMLIVGPAV